MNTKKLIEFLDEQIETRNNVQEHDYLWTEALKEEIAMLKEIKGIVEEKAQPCDHSAIKWNPHNQVVQCHKCGESWKPEPPPQPEEELVEKIMRASHGAPHFQCKAKDKAKGEIRKLLPPRPSVTRKELVMFWGGNLGTFIKLLESKGIEVKEEG